jgi:Flp pilus assembly protein TadG
MAGQSSAPILSRPRQEYFPRAVVVRILSRACDERGSALVEFGVSAVILLTLVFGVMVMSLALYSYHFTAEAARAGARYAMVRGSSCTTYGNFGSNCPVTTSGQIQTYVRTLNFPGINTNNINVTATWPTAGVTCTPSATPCNNPGNVVKVVVSYTFPVNIPFVSPQTLTMTSTAQTVIAD